MVRYLVKVTYKVARRIVVAIVGVSVVLLGIALLVLPGPAFIVIPIGLAILSLEFAWARNWLKKIRERTNQALKKKDYDHDPDHRPYRANYLKHHDTES